MTRIKIWPHDFTKRTLYQTKPLVHTFCQSTCLIARSGLMVIGAWSLTDRQTDGLTDGWTDRETRQTERQTHTETHPPTHTHTQTHTDPRM